MDPPIIEDGPRGQSQTGAIGRCIQHGCYQCSGFQREVIAVRKFKTDFQGDESCQPPQSRGDIARAPWKTAVWTIRKAGGLGIESDPSSTRIEACLPLGGTHSHEVHKMRMAAEACFRRFYWMVRQPQSSGEIISTSQGEDAQQHVGPKRRIR